jgi:hypothetical protein
MAGFTGTEVSKVLFGRGSLSFSVFSCTAHIPGTPHWISKLLILWRPRPELDAEDRDQARAGRQMAARKSDRCSGCPV